MECLIFALFMSPVAFYILHVIIESLEEKNDTPSRMISYSSRANEVLPNGYTRQEYQDYGYSDEDIEYWGFDQPSAPSPSASGYVVNNMLDGLF